MRIRLDPHPLMYSVRLTVEFQAWLDALKDLRTQVRIAARLRLAEAGSLGDWKSIAGELSEMRVDVGPGYRLYFIRRGSILVVMLGGGRQIDSGTRYQASATHPETTGPGTMSKTKAKTQLLPFDAARYLTDDAAIAEYMTAVLETDNLDLLLLALGDVARARGMAQVAKDSGLGRESLYKALAPGAKPRFDTILKVARALGVKLTAHAA
jgi:probable addiction module antidote protein/putative addiction module killer protein